MSNVGSQLLSFGLGQETLTMKIILILAKGNTYPPSTSLTARQWSSMTFEAFLNYIIPPCMRSMERVQCFGVAVTPVSCFWPFLLLPLTLSLMQFNSTVPLANKPESLNPSFINLCKTPKFDVYLTGQALHGLIQQQQFTFYYWAFNDFSFLGRVNSLLAEIEGKKASEFWSEDYRVLNWLTVAKSPFLALNWTCGIERGLEFLYSSLNYWVAQWQVGLSVAKSKDTRLFFVPARFSLPT